MTCCIFFFWESSVQWMSWVYEKSGCWITHAWRRWADGLVCSTESTSSRGWIPQGYVLRSPGRVLIFHISVTFFLPIILLCKCSNMHRNLKNCTVNIHILTAQDSTINILPQICLTHLLTLYFSFNLSCIKIDFKVSCWYQYTHP